MKYLTPQALCVCTDYEVNHNHLGKKVNKNQSMKKSSYIHFDVQYIQIVDPSLQININFEYRFDLDRTFPPPCTLVTSLTLPRRSPPSPPLSLLIYEQEQASHLRVFERGGGRKGRGGGSDRNSVITGEYLYLPKR